MDKLLVALRTRTNQLFELYLEEEPDSADAEEDTMVEEYKLTEEFILKDGKRLRVVDNGSLQQICLANGANRFLVKRAPAGYVIEAATDHVCTACRTLTDGAEHLPVSKDERAILTWAFESIKWLIKNAPAIVGTDG